MVRHCTKCRCKPAPSHAKSFDSFQNVCSPSHISGRLWPCGGWEGGDYRYYTLLTLCKALSKSCVDKKTNKQTNEHCVKRTGSRMPSSCALVQPKTIRTSLQSPNAQTKKNLVFRVVSKTHPNVVNMRKKRTCQKNTSKNRRSPTSHTV